MRISKLNKLLDLWQSKDLITQEQNKKISEFMKERNKENFFRLLKWCSILGAVWLCFGVIISLVNLLDINFFENLCSFLYDYVAKPIDELSHAIFGDKAPYFLWGIAWFLLFGISFYFSFKIKPNQNIDSLNLSDEQKFVLKTNFTLDMLSAIFLSGGFICFNNIMDSKEAYLPFWLIAGLIAFVFLACKYKKNLYLIFSIYFLSLCIGMFTGCGYAAYFLAVTKPLVQTFTGILLIAIGFFLEYKQGEKDDFIMEKFSSTFYWTGLLLTFLALWVATFWGFKADGSFSSIELWIANITLVLMSLASMYIGSKYEKKIFFNYGLNFLIIETYTIVFSHIFTKLPVGIASILLGLFLIYTVKLLKKIYIKKSVADVVKNK